VFIAAPASADVAVQDRLARDWAVHCSMVLLVLFCGRAFVAIKQALAYMSWITLTFLRFAVADVLFVAYLLATGQVRKPTEMKGLPMLVVLAFFGFVG